MSRGRYATLLDRIRWWFARWLFRGVHLEDVTLGEKSITASPASVGDVFRWSTTKAAVAAGDLGMSLETGLPSVFQSGVARDALPGRIVSSGSASVAAATTSTLATLTRNANERLMIAGFVQENTAGAAWDPTFATAAAATDDVHYWLERTANANEFTVRARNENAANARTLDWMVVGVIPSTLPLDTVAFRVNLADSAAAAAAGLVVTRTGGTMWPESSAGVTSAVGNNALVWESRGTDEPIDPNVGGVWVFGNTNNNLRGIAFDFSNTNYTHDAGIVYTPNAANGPDGTLTADRIKDNDAVNPARVYRALVNGVGIWSVFYKVVAGDPPTVAGDLATDINPAAANFNGVSLGSDTAWHRKILRVTATTVDFTLYPAGNQLGGVADLPPTGAGDFWGASSVSSGAGRRLILPMVTGSAASGDELVKSPNSWLTQLVVNGVVDVEVAFVPGSETKDYTSELATATLLEWQTPNGTCAIQYQTSNGTDLRFWNVKLNGSNRLAAVATSGQAPMNGLWRWGDEVRLRLHATSTDIWFSVMVNAAVAQTAHATWAGTLATPTQINLGSTSTNDWVYGRVSDFLTYSTHREMTDYSARPAQVVFLGDSISALGAGSIDWMATAVAMATPTQARAGTRIAVLAKLNATIATQRAIWDASSFKGAPWVRAIIMQDGANDLNSGGRTAAQMSADKAAEVADMRSTNPEAAIVCGYLTPIDTWAGMNNTKRGYWIDYNHDLDGSGPNPIAGIHVVVTSGSNTLNNNGAIGPINANVLKAIYDVQLDGAHPGNNGKEVMAAGYVTGLASVGIVL